MSGGLRVMVKIGTFRYMLKCTKPADYDHTGVKAAWAEGRLGQAFGERSIFF